MTIKPSVDLCGGEMILYLDFTDDYESIADKTASDCT